NGYSGFHCKYFFRFAGISYVAKSTGDTYISSRVMYGKKFVVSRKKTVEAASKNASPMFRTVKIAITTGNMINGKPKGWPSTYWKTAYTAIVGKKSRSARNVACNGSTARGNAEFSTMPRPFISERAPLFIDACTN